MNFRTRFERKRVGLAISKPSLTQSQYQKDTDINVMIRKALGGDASAIRRGTYGDFRDIPESLHDASNITAAARTTWEEMPERIKQTYGSPEAYVNAVISEMSKTPANPATPKTPETNEKIDEPSTGEACA